ncbi:MAG TPA: hypothetical protein EYP56_19835 [Planctomycetaceae bacterium]|nr:hypothetical protein [Planctomycetaceae bacterium]HIQ20373.1 hypothetical protein [Planctomycetota bacterium]
MHGHFRCPTIGDSLSQRPRAGWVGLAAVLVVLHSWAARAQQPEVHYFHHGIMPPGAIGGVQLQRGGPVAGFFQPVEITAPQGVSVALAENGLFVPPQQTPIKVGLLIGQVYRLRVVNIPFYEGLEVYPTIEVIDRLYAPPDQIWRFPIEVVITEEDLRLALEGKFVTRVVYLEDPRVALPAAKEVQGQGWFDVAPDRDPLAVADQLGRPVAILRLGARFPNNPLVPDPTFLFGSPPWVRFTSPPASEPGDLEARKQGPSATTSENAVTRAQGESRRPTGRTAHKGALAYGNQRVPTSLKPVR